MEEKVLIQSVRIYPYISLEDTKAQVELMLKNDSNELLLVPDLERENLYQGLLLEKYYTTAIDDSTCIRNSHTEGPFHYFTISRHALRAYLQSLRKHMDPAFTVKKPSSHFESLDDPFDMFMDEIDKMPPSPPVVTNPYLRFLQTHTPTEIQRNLDERVIGQSQLTRAVGDFLYYHALRQVHPDLPQRPLLIAGPSGSGKTQVWRAAANLYGDVFTIQIVDGSNLSCDGWSGNYKLSTFVTPQLADGGILVVDEFDKLVKPKFASGGDNVSLQMQAEFLKLIEGEHHVTVNKKQTDTTSKKMGFVMVGAFEDLRDRKNQRKVSIGFRNEPAQEAADSVEFTDEDFISYGIMPEIVGRIAAKCATQPLDEQAYLRIILSSHSRVTAIANVLAQYGIQAEQVIPQEELLKLIAKSKSNRTGVRWVSAQVENRLLEAIWEQGLFPERPKAAA